MEELKDILRPQTILEIKQKYEDRARNLVMEILEQYNLEKIDHNEVFDLPEVHTFMDDSIDDMITTIESAFDLEDTIKSDLEDVVYDALVNKGIISTFDEEEDAEIGMINPIPDSWPSAKKLQKELDQIEKEEENETSSVWNDWD